MPAALTGPVLTLDAAGDGCAAGLVRAGLPSIERVHDGFRGAAAILPALAASVLNDAGLRAADLHAVAVTVGPGSFTGVRAALALAQGIGLATGVPVWGVTVGAAVRASADAPGPVWVAIDSKRDHLFLDRDGVVESVPLSALPRPDASVLVAGTAAGQLGGGRVLPITRPCPAGVAQAASVARLAPEPLYLDAPEARPNLARAAPLA